MEFVDRIDEQRRLHQALHGEKPSGLGCEWNAV